MWRKVVTFKFLQHRPLERTAVTLNSRKRLDVSEERKISGPYRKLNPEPSSSLCRPYTYYTTPAPRLEEYYPKNSGSIFLENFVAIKNTWRYIPGDRSVITLHIKHRVQIKLFTNFPFVIVNKYWCISPATYQNDVIGYVGSVDVMEIIKNSVRFADTVTADTGHGGLFPEHCGRRLSQSLIGFPVASSRHQLCGNAN